MTILSFLGSMFGRPPPAAPPPPSAAAPSANGPPSVLPGDPKTKGYRPSIGQYPGWIGSGFGTGFNLGLVDEMKRDAQVKQCLRYLKAPLHLAEFVYAGDPAQAKFADQTLKRFWRKSLAVALMSAEYGYSVAEPIHKFGDDGKVHFNYLKPIHPKDAKAWTVGGKLDFVKVKNIQGQAGGEVTLHPAKGDRLGEVFWLTNEPTFSPFYGHSVLSPAWVFWRWKTIPDGAIETVAKWAYKHSVGPLVLRHPDEIFETGDAGSTSVVEAQDIMREMGEKMKAMAVICMSSATRPDGKYKWAIESYGEPKGNATALIEWLDWLDKAMRRGIGIPDEIIDHDGNTGGYSRSQVAVQAYFAAAELALNHVLEAVWDQLVAPLLKLNFGSVKCKAEPKPLLPPEQPEQGKEGAGGQGPPKPPSMSPQPEQPKKPVSFSLGVTLPAGAALAPEHWGDIVTRLATNVRIIGPSGSGKSTVAQAIASSTDGKIFIIDPVYEPGNWGGLPAVTVNTDGSYDPIEKAIDGLLGEMKYRGAMLQGGNAHFERLTIIFDEVPDTVSELPNSAGLMIRRLAQRGRHENMHLIGIGQSDRVEAWGIGGYGDVSESFVTIYLGSKAYEAMPELVGQERPAVLEWQGVRYPIDLSEILGLAERPIPADRLFKLPTAKQQGEPAQLSLGVPSLYDRIRQGLQGQRTAARQSETLPEVQSVIHQVQSIAQRMERQEQREMTRLSLAGSATAQPNLTLNLSDNIAQKMDQGIGDAIKELADGARQQAEAVQQQTEAVVQGGKESTEAVKQLADAIASQKQRDVVVDTKPMADAVKDMAASNQQLAEAVGKQAAAIANQKPPQIINDNKLIAEMVRKLFDKLSAMKPPVPLQPKSSTKVVTKRDSDHLAVEIKETFEY